MSDATDQLPEVTHGGETYRLGLRLPPTYPDTFPRLSTAAGFRVWSRAEILDAIKAKPVKRRTQFAGDKWVKQQGQVGSCNAAAATGVLRRCMALGGRNDVPDLNWEFLYAQVNGGRDQGSMLDDGMQALVDVGVPPFKPGHRFNRDIYKQHYTPEDYRDAAAFKATDCFTVSTPEELATLVLSGQGAAVVAVHVGGSFLRLDAKGFAGADAGPGNHAVLVCDAEVIDGELAFDHCGSWGVNTHAGGYAYFSWPRHFAQTIKHHAFYAVLAATNDGRNAPAVTE